MSFRSVLAHRAKVLELVVDEFSGYPVHEWSPVQVDDEDLVIRCFLDLSKSADDPLWTVEQGRAADRRGRLFCESSAPLKANSRLLMTKGPVGTFAVQQAIEEAHTPTSFHHLEVAVVEVAR